MTLSDSTSGRNHLLHHQRNYSEHRPRPQYSGPGSRLARRRHCEAIASCYRRHQQYAVASAALTPSAQRLARRPISRSGQTSSNQPSSTWALTSVARTIYDSGQISRNLTVRNPGFEAEIWSSLLNCQAATATTCTDADAYTVWPANFLQGATFEVSLRSSQRADRHRRRKHHQ